MFESVSEGLESLPSAADAADGESLTVEQAIANLQGQDQGLRYYAAWWLGRFRVRESAAIEALIAALEMRLTGRQKEATPCGGMLRGHWVS
jgi:phycocyanobilin lyase alpha subunit